MNTQALSPQGYNINDNPMNTNPFWDQELDPTALARLEQAEQDINDLEQNKQDALVSGTNIKTINGQSVLGSGNIEIQGGGGTTNAVWGQITGTLMDQTDLANMLATKANITAFNNYYNKSEIDDLEQNKQDVLVSGTNIKTINGTSILGGGNIEIQPGTNAVWGQITGTLADQTDLVNILATKANTTAFNNYYNKSEIDAMIGDIQTILEGI